MKYKYTHTAFVEALNKILAERLFKVQDAQELNDPEKCHFISNIFPSFLTESPGQNLSHCSLHI